MHYSLGTVTGSADCKGRQAGNLWRLATLFPDRQRYDRTDGLGLVFLVGEGRINRPSRSYRACCDGLYGGFPDSGSHGVTLPLLPPQHLQAAG
jgi:hypothetical protein